ncbi:MAG: trehalase family glycosidase, partial [Lentisphaeria bacterium]
AIYHNFKLADFDNSKGRMEVKEGWNRILIVQQLNFSSYGFTLNLDADPILFQILREANIESLPGWIISGPIKTPLDRITGNMHIGVNCSESYYSLSSLDNSAYQHTLKFKKDSSNLETISMNYIELTSNQFITLDLGQIYYAIPQLSIDGADGDIIDISCGPSVVNGVVEPLSAGRTRNVNTVILDGEKDQWVDFHPRGFRYLMIVAHKVKDKIIITNINAKSNKYEFVDSGYLSTNDNLLNQIWETSLNTLRGTISMKMMDGAERENSQYIADCMIQAQAEFFHRGDYLSSQKALREFATIQYESGEMPAMHPSDVRFHLLDFSMLYPEWLRQHYLYTGDKNLIIELEENIHLLFKYFETLRVQNEEVIFIQNTNNEYFIDLNASNQEGISVAINAFYCRSLLSAAFLFDEIGKTEQADLLKAKATQVSNVINNLCWSNSRGEFADYWSNDGRSKDYSWHTQILSIYGGIATEEQASIIIEKLFPLKQPYASFINDGFYTPYFMYYALEVLFSRGFKDRGLNLMRHFWGSMLAEDDLKTWPEMFGPNVSGRKIAGSACMGYSVSPTIYLVKEIAGVTPAIAGFKKIYFSPRLDLVNKLNLQIPTLSGSIDISWHETDFGKFLIKIDANYPLEVIPMYDLLENIQIELHVTDSVTVTEKL